MMSTAARYRLAAKGQFPRLAGMGDRIYGFKRCVKAQSAEILDFGFWINPIVKTRRLRIRKISFFTINNGASTK